MYVFDTDTLSNIVKSRPAPLLLEKLSSLSLEFQYTTSINSAEIYYGAHRSPNKDIILRAFEEAVFPNVKILPFDEKSAKVYGKLKAKLEKKGTHKSEPDLRIASIALQHGFILVSGNVRHFQDIPRLKIENWIE
ncbi:MAG: type II toxin-antitoxin system VapC family toxin [Candidatus Aminicenantes bacterium]|nr:MAG: type II toxin-antitoxin system VapC family toxin [Candidatus Aminicenantes bacterium]